MDPNGIAQPHLDHCTSVENQSLKIFELPRGRMLENSGQRAVVEQPDTNVEPTDFKVLPDKSLLEVVADPQNPDGLRLLHWSHSRIEFGERLELGGKTFTPPRLSPSFIRAVRLPIGISPSRDSRNMVNRISEVFDPFLDVPEHMLIRVAGFILATWFPEILPVAPLLWITGPPVSGKTTLLILLHCACRRPILLTDMTPAGLYSVPGLLRPALLIDECELGRSATDQHVMRLIRAGTTPGVHVARKHDMFDLFCPKAVASRLCPEDEALASRAIFVTMRPTHRVLRALDPQLVLSVADALQSELLDFRLANYHRVALPELPAASDLNPRTLQIARSLAAPFRADLLLEETLIQSLREQDQEADAVRSDQPEWLVVEALFALCHEKKVGELFVQGITDRVNHILAARGDDRRFKPRRIGSILKVLSVKTERLGSWGRGVRMSHQYHRQVHKLAQDFGVTRRDIANWMAVRSGSGGSPCELCKEFDLETGLRYLQMKPKTQSRLFHAR